MTILKTSRKSKISNKTPLYTVILLFVLIGECFIVHQLAKNQPPVTIDTTREKAAPVQFTDASLKLFIASRRGKTYYYPWCSGGMNISEANRIWFLSQAVAQDAGYVPSKSCKDLLP